MAGISGDRVEIDPVQVRSSLNVSKFLSKPRAVTYQMDAIMECRLLDVKYGGRCHIECIHSTNRWMPGVFKTRATL